MLNCDSLFGGDHRLQRAEIKSIPTRIDNGFIIAKSFGTLVLRFLESLELSEENVLHTFDFEI